MIDTRHWSSSEKNRAVYFQIPKRKLKQGTGRDKSLSMHTEESAFWLCLRPRELKHANSKNNLISFLTYLINCLQQQAKINGPSQNYNLTRGNSLMDEEWPRDFKDKPSEKHQGCIPAWSIFNSSLHPYMQYWPRSITDFLQSSEYLSNSARIEIWSQEFCKAWKPKREHTKTWSHRRAIFVKEVLHFVSIKFHHKKLWQFKMLLQFKNFGTIHLHNAIVGTIGMSSLKQTYSLFWWLKGVSKRLGVHLHLSFSLKCKHSNFFPDVFIDAVKPQIQCILVLLNSAFNCFIRTILNKQYSGTFLRRNSLKP